MSAMDTSLEPTVEQIKEEQPDYDDGEDDEEWDADAEEITVKVEPTGTISREDCGNSDLEDPENEYPVFQSQLLQNFNPNQFYIARLSQRLNSKLLKISSQNGDSLSSAIGPNYCGVSEENRIGGDALQCSWCPAHATNVQELRLHEKVCSLAPSNGPSEQSNHFDEDGVERPFACDICDKRFARNWYLKRHYVTHSNARPYRCVVCEEEFSTAQSLKDHQNTHIKDMPYICSKCNRGFPSREVLKEHARTHIKDMPFSCRVCSKRFMQAKNLKVHMKAHSGHTIYPCDECEKSFESADDRVSHKKQHSLVMPFKCGVCNQAFPTLRQMQRHSDLHGAENPKKCDQCDKKFSSEAWYRKHVKEVHGEVSSACPDCQLLAKSFTCDDSEELLCEDCELPFLHQKCLDSHVKEHQTEKVPCVKCGKEFPLVSAYHRHMLTHTGEQPYTCTECKTRFSTRTELKEHMRKHWRDRPFACKVCGEKFSFNKMMAHLLSHAKKEETVSCEAGNTRKEAKVDGNGNGEKRRRDSEEKSVGKPVAKETGNTGGNLGVKGKIVGRRRVDVYVEVRGETSLLNETENTQGDSDVTRKNEKRRKKDKEVEEEENEGKAVSNKTGNKAGKHVEASAKRGGKLRKGGGKTVLNETGNIQRDLQDDENNEDRRRSLRSKSQYSYFEGSSDEFESFDE